MATANASSLAQVDNGNASSGTGASTWQTVHQKPQAGGQSI